MSTWFLVGGGPSLIGFDWSRLVDRNVLAINRAYECCPQAQVIYFSDKRFWNWHGEQLKNHTGRVISGAHRLRVTGVESYQFSGVEGLDLTRGKLRHGNSSGYAAINLAVHLGAKKIVLLGYDMRMVDDRAHWHDGYPVVARQNVFDKMHAFFETMIPQLKQLDITVLNACPGSRIDAFLKISHEEALCQ